jgi:hypothetical protein
MLFRGLPGVAALALIFLAAATPLSASPAVVPAQKSSAKKDSKGVGVVYGRVLKPDGKPLGGAFLMIENLELGMIYRTDINPIGQFRFNDVYPGTYRLKLSPAVYLIKAPAQFSVKADEAHEVMVQVVPAPKETMQ